MPGSKGGYSPHGTTQKGGIDGADFTDTLATCVSGRPRPPGMCGIGDSAKVHFFVMYSKGGQALNGTGGSQTWQYWPGSPLATAD